MFCILIIVLTLCTVVACWAISKILDAIFNLKALLHNKKHYRNITSTGMVYNKKTKKLEADNSQAQPFE